MAGFKKEPSVPVDDKFYGFRYRPTNEVAKKLRTISLACDMSANELLIKLVDYALLHARIREKKLTVRDLTFDDEVRVFTIEDIGGAEE